MDAIAAVASVLPSVDIFSLNHDLLIERLLHKAGIPFADGFAERDGDVLRFNWSWNSGEPEPQISPSASRHMYGNGALCLYKPTEHPWKSSDNIHEKIIPWTAEWLVFYELYLMCGKWLGPEAEHGIVEKMQQTKTR